MHDLRKTKIAVITNDGFASLTGGSILNRNLFRDYGDQNLLSLDSMDQGTLNSGVKRISLRPYILGLGLQRHADSVKAAVSDNNDRAEKRSLPGKLLRVLLGDASQPTYPFRRKSLYKQVRDFSPDVIYTTMGSYAVHKFVLDLSRKMRIPVIIHVMDDWVAAKNNKGLLSYIQGWLIRSTFRELLRISSLRYVISEGMKTAYENRYGYRFHILGNVVESAWLKKGNVRKRRNNGCVSIGYVGSFTDNSQQEPIRDVLTAVSELNATGYAREFKLQLFVTPSTFKYAKACFSGREDIEISVAPVGDDEFYGLLGSFDILLLPSAFSGPSKEYIKYSVPAKLYSYLAVGAAILFYGDSENEQIKIALRNNLGAVVTERSASAIRKALIDIVEDEVKTQASLERQFEYVKNSCDAVLVRKKLYASIDESIYPGFGQAQNESSHDYNYLLLTKKRQLIDSLIRKLRPRSILDFGGGTGHTFSRYIHEKYPDIKLTLFDISSESLEAASWARQNMEKIDKLSLLRARKYDLVIASEVVEHVAPEEYVLKDIATLVDENGSLFVTVPNGYGSYELTVLLYRLLAKYVLSLFVTTKRRRASESTLSLSPHVAFYRYSTLTRSFKCAGLVIEGYYPIVLSHFRLSRILSSVWPWAMKKNIGVLPHVNPCLIDDWGFLLTKSKELNSTDGCRNLITSLSTNFNVFRARLNQGRNV